MIAFVHGECREAMRAMAPASVHCCITSPPYFGLRSYLPQDHPLKDREIGLEKKPEDFVESLVEVFREVRRVLRDDGVLWLNLGDSYANDAKWGGSTGGKHAKALAGNTGVGRGKTSTGLPPKCLMGMPWRVALALVADGWTLRSDVVWAKPSPMPESVKDRPTRAHEYVFMLSKSARYFYDAFAVLEPVTGNSRGKRNLRTVWTIASQTVQEAHYATFPEALVATCMAAGTSERGACSACGAQHERVVVRVREEDDTLSLRSTGWRARCSCSAALAAPMVLDPFAGSGTVGVVAARLGRQATLIELSEDYVAIQRRRCAQVGLMEAAS